ncbi:hypothetical protein [Nonomuraea aurantiaca]|uniref:hypothetical protein n=1 Tax=Nonomuraea aurantiaca TaxID=2878562 RepID=UPI001CD99FDB|nr:hypothetical protein [Nonomuraea aurantiaca]MCA2220863.1 hypothetical protein [Nonomuraea aurantiaca]
MILPALALALVWWIASGLPWPSGDGDTQTRQDEAPVLADATGATSAPATDAGSPATDTGSPAIGTGSPATGTGQAARQAAGLDDLLTNSHSTRASLSGAIARASACERSGMNAIQNITANRRDQLTMAQALDLTALPEGPALKESLVAVLDASYRADAAFLTWARRHLAKGCTGPIALDPDYRRGLDKSGDAQAAKALFVEAWRPIAQTYGLTHWKADDI